MLGGRNSLKGLYRDYIGSSIGVTTVDSRCLGYGSHNYLGSCVQQNTFRNSGSSKNVFIMFATIILETLNPEP